MAYRETQRSEKMRLENLTDLANLLRSIDNSEDSELGFDMSVTYIDKEHSSHMCGSACCISGWVQYCNPETRGRSLTEVVLSISPEGTSFDEAYDLCFPRADESWKATPQQAARAVEIDQFCVYHKHLPHMPLRGTSDRIELAAARKMISEMMPWARLGVAIMKDWPEEGGE
jgi:hypothetical protein